MLRSPGEEEEPGPCVSAHSLSGDSAQTMDYTAELHTGVEEIQSHEVTPFGMASQVDAAVGVGQAALLDSADDMAVQPDAPESGSVAGVDGVRMGGAAGERMWPFSTAGRQDSASYQILPPVLVQRQDSASFQQEELEESRGFMAVRGDRLEPVRLGDSATDLTHDQTDAQAPPPRPRGERSRLGALAQRASGLLQGRPQRSASAVQLADFDHQFASSVAERGPSLSLEAARRAVLSSFLTPAAPAVAAPDSPARLPPSRQDSALHSLAEARRAVLAELGSSRPLPPAPSGRHDLGEIQPDSPLHSLEEVRRAVLAEVGGWRAAAPAPLPYDASPAGPSFISPDEEPANRPSGSSQGAPLPSLEEVRRAVFADLAATRSLPANVARGAASPSGQALPPTPRDSLTSRGSLSFLRGTAFWGRQRGPAPDAGASASETGPSAPEAGPSAPLERQDSALHTLMQARLVVLSERGHMRRGSLPASVQSLSYPPEGSALEAGGSGASAWASQSVSGCRHHSLTSREGGRGARAGQATGWRRSESGILLEARRAVLQDLALNPPPPPEASTSTPFDMAPGPSGSGSGGALPLLWRNSPIDTVRGEAAHAAAPLGPARASSAGPAHPDSPMHQPGMPFGQVMPGTSGSAAGPRRGAFASALEARPSGYDSASELDA